MKKFKKPLALILALMMAFSAMVIPAGAADEDEGIMPYPAARPCSNPNCGGSVSPYSTVESDTKYQTCSLCSYSHPHSVKYRCYYEGCSSCSYRQLLSKVEISNVCNHNDK